MNREIIFRGLRTDGKGWVYGNVQVPKPPYDKWHMWADSQIQVEVISETVGQYTGLKDKNGKMIFEGDMLISPVGSVHITTWLDGSFYLKSRRRNGSYLYVEIGKGLLNNKEIIGNIHDENRE